MQKNHRKKSPSKSPAKKEKTNIKKGINWRAKLESGLCVLLAGFIGWYTKFPEAFYHNAQGIWLYSAVASAFTFVSIFCYIAIYLPVFEKKTVDFDHWETEIPKSIQTATISGIINFISLTGLVWSSYSFYSPFIVFILLLGSISLASLIG